MYHVKPSRKLYRSIRLSARQDASALVSIHGQTVWNSSFGDPQFLLDVGNPGLRPGVYRLSVGVHGHHNMLVRPRLYLDYGEGFSEENSISLVGRPNSNGYLTFLFRVENFCKVIRFDPTEEAGTFVLSLEAKLVRVAKLHLQFSALKRAFSAKPLGSNKKLIRYGWELYRRGGLRAISQELTNYNPPNAAVPPAPVFSTDMLSLSSLEPHSIESNLSVGIQLHLYYHDLAEEFYSYLSNMPVLFSLYISVGSQDGADKAKSIFSTLKNLRHLDIRIVPNKGRDIGPLVAEFGSALMAHEIVCHIQSKKSLYNGGATDGWRRYLLDSLFGGKERIEKILSLLAQKKYGIIYPQCFYNVPYMANTWLGNAGIANVWKARLGVNKLPVGYFDFPVGSMFWARSDAIAPLLNSAISWDDFPEEFGQTDGTLAHCIERMLGVVPASRGYNLGILADDKHPTWSKWRLNQFAERPIGHIQSQIINHDIKLVVFDIFDTLLTRPFLDPEISKEILDLEAARTGMKDFKSLRIEAERDARTLSDRDIAIGEIYEILKHTFDEAISPVREISLELKSIRRREAVCELLDLAVRNGKRVVLASDMFLPRNVIEQMLESAGVSGWSALYLSSEIGLRKDRGDLYTHILEVESITPQQAVMVGDNERSDFQIPSDMGFKAVHLLSPNAFLRGVPVFEKRLRFQEVSPSKNVLFGLIATKLFGGLNHPDFRPISAFGNNSYDIGYSVVGPLLASFCQWLIDASAKSSVSKLHFLAREGKLLKAAFDLWVEGRSNVPQSNYLVVSRRAVSVPAIETVEDIMTLASSNNFYRNRLDIFLSERYGLELDKELTGKLVGEGIMPQDGNVAVIDGDITEVKTILTALTSEIFENAKSERQSMLSYLAAAGVLAGEKQAVVDVGYSGTIQKFLMKLTAAKVNGYYFATEEKAGTVASNFGVSIEACFASNIKKSPQAPAIFLHSFFLEKMLSAHDAQVLKYENDTPVFRELRQEELLCRDTRQQIQAGALQFVVDARKIQSEMSSDLSISPSDGLIMFEAFTSDVYEDAKSFLSSIALDDDYCGRGVVS